MKNSILKFKLKIIIFFNNIIRNSKYLNFLIYKLNSSNIKYLEKYYLNITKEQYLQIFENNLFDFLQIILSVNFNHRLQIKYYFIIKQYFKKQYIDYLSILKDVIAVNYIGRQYYGTQINETQNNLKFYPIIGIAKEFDNLINDNKFDILNKRRNLVQLNNIEDYIRELTIKYKKIVSMDILKKNIKL